MNRSEIQSPIGIAARKLRAAEDRLGEVQDILQRADIPEAQKAACHEALRKVLLPMLHLEEVLRKAVKG